MSLTCGRLHSLRVADNSSGIIASAGGLITAVFVVVIIVIRYTVIRRSAENITVGKFLRPEPRGDRLDGLR